jgi:hypothetical protein
MKATTARSSLVGLLLVVACSSSAKQSDESSARSGSAPVAPAPTTAAPRSGADPWAEKPRDPAADAAALRADIDMMCAAAKTTGGKTVMDVGPYIAEHMQTSFKVELFADIRTTTLDEFLDRMRKGMAKTGVTKCDTLDVLIANDPRQKHE